MTSAHIFVLLSLLVQDTLQTLASVLQLVQLRCALIRLRRISEAGLLLLLQLGCGLVDSLVLHVFDLVGFTQVTLSRVDVCVQIAAFVLGSRDILIEFGHFNLTLVDHALGFNDGTIC